MSAVPGTPPRHQRFALDRELHELVTPIERSKLRDPSYQAYALLRIAFVALPLAMGIDKYFNSMVYWPQYLAGWINNIIP